MPFASAWTDRAGSQDFVDEFVAFHQRQRESWRADDWTLLLCVWAGDELIGTQGIEAENFQSERTVASGSWLGQRYQRRGYGTEMRAAILELAFTGLGAAAAESGALEGNLASERVSEKLGYVPSGVGIVSPRGAEVTEHRFRLEREAWEALEGRPPVELEGLGPCLPLFGL